MREGVRASLLQGTLTIVIGREHGIARVAVNVRDAQQSQSLEEPGGGCRSGMGFDHKGISHQRRDSHHRQPASREDADVAVHFGQDALEIVFFPDHPGIGAAGRPHQVMDQVIVPARAGARHSDGKYDHRFSYPSP